MNERNKKKKKNKPGTPGRFKKSRHNHKRQNTKAQPEQQVMPDTSEAEDDARTDLTQTVEATSENTAGQNGSCDCGTVLTGNRPPDLKSFQKFILSDLTAFDFPEEPPAPKETDDADTVEVIGVKFKRGGGILFAPGEIRRLRGPCIVETAAVLSTARSGWPTEKSLQRHSAPAPPGNPAGNPRGHRTPRAEQGKGKRGVRICLRKLQNTALTFSWSKRTPSTI